MEIRTSNDRPPRDQSQALTPDQREIERTLKLFIPDGQVSFLFAKNVTRVGDQPRNYGGYFIGRQCEEVARSACELSSESNALYFHPNPIQRSCEQNELGIFEPLRRGGSVKKTDVTHRKWLLIDVDPKRPAECSSSVNEHHLAGRMIAALQAYLFDQWGVQPIVADTGNGFHLLFHVDLPVDSHLPHNLLRTLSSEFSSNDAGQQNLDFTDL